MEMNNVFPWEPLEKWSAMAFLIVGGLWSADSVLLGLERGMGIHIPDAVFPVFILSAMLVSVIGLFGFYPRLVDKAPRLARSSVVVTVAAGVGFTVLLMWWVAANVLTTVPIPPPALLIVTIFTVFLGFLLFGVASARTATPSRTVGLLLLAVVVTLIVYLITQAVYGANAPSWVSPALTTILTVVTLAIGILLRTNTVPADRAELETDSTVK